MKNLFEEPRLELEVFAVSDNTLFLLSDVLDEDELDPAYGNSVYN